MEKKAAIELIKDFVREGLCIDHIVGRRLAVKVRGCIERGEPIDALLNEPCSLLPPVMLGKIAIGRTFRLGYNFDVCCVLARHGRLVVFENSEGFCMELAYDTMVYPEPL